MPTRAPTSPARPSIPGLNFIPTPPRNRHLDGAFANDGGVDSPPRKLSAATSSSGSGAPSPRRKPRRGRGGGKDNKKSADPSTRKATRDESDVDKSITRFFPKSPPAMNNNNNHAVQALRAKESSSSSPSPKDSAACHRCYATDAVVTGVENGELDATSNGRHDSQLNGVATTLQNGAVMTPGKKKKRRRKKTAKVELKPAVGEADENARRQSQLTEFYQVRRSDRRPKSLKEAEERAVISAKIKGSSADGLDVREIPGKGRGVLATKPFKRGDFVVEYDGDLISVDEANRRESAYRENPAIGCYMYYFNFRERRFCVDATSESGKFGRLINHSTKSPNLTTRLFPIGDRPHLIFVAARDLDVGEELMYDYGDRSRDATAAHPWLKS